MKIDPAIHRNYDFRYAHLAVAMYRGIALKELVIARGRGRLIAFLGIDNLNNKKIEVDLAPIRGALELGHSFGANLLSHFDMPQSEISTVVLFLQHGVKHAEAAAFMQIMPALVWCRAYDLRRDDSGSICFEHEVLGTLSCPEPVAMFMSLGQERIVVDLLAQWRITLEQAAMAKSVPMSHDICDEAHSKGPTDQCLALALLFAVQNLCTSMHARHGYKQPFCVSLEGGIGTMQAAVSAVNADFILTGSIVHWMVERAACDLAKDMLQEIHVQNTDHAPVSDLFETGALVQVIKEGVLFPTRANKRYIPYSQCEPWEAFLKATRAQAKSKILRHCLQEVWEEVLAYPKRRRHATLLEQARKDLKRKMAVVSCWYFKRSRTITSQDKQSYHLEFQVHTGPAPGAFNQRVADMLLHNWRKRWVDDIAERLMAATAELLSQRATAWLAPAVSGGRA